VLARPVIDLGECVFRLGGSAFLNAHEGTRPPRERAPELSAAAGSRQGCGLRMVAIRQAVLNSRCQSLLRLLQRPKEFEAILLDERLNFLVGQLSPYRSSRQR
jgi:hypothetical protein